MVVRPPPAPYPVPPQPPIAVPVKSPTRTRKDSPGTTASAPDTNAPYPPLYDDHGPPPDPHRFTQMYDGFGAFEGTAQYCAAALVVKEYVGQIEGSQMGVGEGAGVDEGVGGGVGEFDGVGVDVCDAGCPNIISSGDAATGSHGCHPDGSAEMMAKPGLLGVPAVPPGRGVKKKVPTIASAT